MPIDVQVLDRLLTKVIDLAKTRREDRTALFKDFVEPTWKLLEETHKDYLETLEKLRQLLWASEEPMNDEHPVIKQLERDSIYSSHIRNAVRQAAHALPRSECRKFVEAVFEYLGTQLSPTGDEYDQLLGFRIDGHQRPRQSLRRAMLAAVKDDREFERIRAARGQKPIPTIHRFTKIPVDPERLEWNEWERVAVPRNPVNVDRHAAEQEIMRLVHSLQIYFEKATNDFQALRRDLLKR